MGWLRNGADAVYLKRVFLRVCKPFAGNGSIVARDWSPWGGLNGMNGDV